MIELKEFLEIISLLEKNYDKKLPDEIVKIWHGEFGTWGKELFRHAVVETIKNEQFFPTINKVKEYRDVNRTWVGEDGFKYVNGRRQIEC